MNNSTPPLIRKKSKTHLKKITARKKGMRKRKQSIQKLIHILKNESSGHPSQLEDSVICLEDITTHPKRQKTDKIVLSSDDEEVEATIVSPKQSNKTSIVSSTPKSNQNFSTLKKLNLSRVEVDLTRDNDVTNDINDLTTYINDVTNDINDNNVTSNVNTKDSFITIDEDSFSKTKVSKAVFDLTKDRSNARSTQMDTSEKSETLYTVDLTLGERSLDNADNFGNENEDTVIDLEKDNKSRRSSIKSFFSFSDSDATIVIPSTSSKKRKLTKIAEKIDSLDSKQKTNLLNRICVEIFNGCDLSKVNSVASTSRAPQTSADKFIKNVILKEKASRNSVGSNIYNPVRKKKRDGLRFIVIDGSNVAMGHSNGSFFSVRGLKICIDYFLNRGHRVKAFVPRFRCKRGKSSDPGLLDQMERQGLIVYTPSREVQGRNICSYDDRYIVQCACEFDGVIVTLDNYRDLCMESERWRKFIENRLLPFTWVEDMIMFPEDPLGRSGPKLAQFLKHDSTHSLKSIQSVESEHSVA